MLLARLAQGMEIGRKSVAGRSESAAGRETIVREYIERHYPTRITVDRMATACGMNCRDFNVWFEACFGLAWRDYLECYRIDQAKRLFGAGCPCVAEVATRVGFDDLPRFVRLFEMQVGMGPSAYRDNLATSD